MNQELKKLLYPDIYIIDCEASGLDEESYPIQIGLYNPSTGDSDCFYIRPKDEWKGYWSEAAEFVHNIPMKTLFEQGIPVDDGIDTLIKMLYAHDNIVYCDAPPFDEFWLSRLFEDKTEDFRINYFPEVRHIDDLLEDNFQRIILHNYLSNAFRKHDALDDCKTIAECYQKTIKELIDKE